MDFSLGELFVIAVIAILVVRPSDWPQLMRHAGKTVGWLRRESAHWMQWLESWDKPEREKILGQDGQYYETYATELEELKQDGKKDANYSQS